MKLTVSAATVAGLLAAASAGVRALEADLEWEVGAGARWITSASSIMRFSNDSAPCNTEWIGVGWQSGSLSMQRRADGTSHMVFQLTPPTAEFQAILGKASAVTEPHYQSTVQGPSQVRLETKIVANHKLPYRFKVEAHHDIHLNRTTYEALYSSEDHWVYLGSLVLQHPSAVATTPADRAAVASTPQLDASQPPATSGSASADTDSDGSETDDNDDGDGDDSDDESRHSKELYARPQSSAPFGELLRSGFSSLRKQASKMWSEHQSSQSRTEHQSSQSRTEHQS
ncbi:hypothetical protein IWQ57_004895, partial [Coemansia nantahalensis]